MRTRILVLLLVITSLGFVVFSPITASFGRSAVAAAEDGKRKFVGEATIPTPKDVLGFTPGDDRKLASWSQIVDYFKRLDAASDRVVFEEIGKTTMGAPFTFATISAPENLRRLGEYKEIQRKLADPRLLGRSAAVLSKDLIARGKTVVLITCGIHSTEVGGPLTSMLIAHRLASSDEPEIKAILENTIVLLVPSLNPDGVDIVKNWYDKTLGTPFEGTSPPELYHKYVGHDNNRDWYAFTQVETQLTVDKIHNVWHPQIVHDIHQQGSNGSRLFLPPYLDPVEPNVPKQIIEGYTELGLAMMDELHAKGFTGISNRTSYDAWTPARAYSHYHGGVRILSETASARIATPITIPFEQLAGRGETFDPKKASANFPKVWQGGEWHLRDITNYMTSAAFALMNHAAKNRERWVSRFYEIGKEAVRPRKKGELWGFKIAASSNTPFLIQALVRGGVEYGFMSGRKPAKVESLTGVQVTYPSDTLIISTVQPNGMFAKALLELQKYPDLRNTNNEPIPPYDVTSHSLALLMSVLVSPINTPFKGSVLRRAKVLREISDCLLDGRKEIAIYKSHVPAMDEGWTRWILGVCTENESILDQDIRAGNFEQKDRSSYSLRLNKDTKYHVIIFPDQNARAILNGHRKGTMPDEYTGGVGEEGVKALREFVEAGGTLIFFNNASNFAIEQFKLPVRDITEGWNRTEFYCPGSILRTEIDTTHPIAKGMPRESIAWFEDSPVFEISDPAQASRVHVIAKYPATNDPLLSGWLLGGDRIKGKAALVEVLMGKGRVVLFGFRPQYRGQSLATYPLIFNALSNR